MFLSIVKRFFYGFFLAGLLLAGISVGAPTPALAIEYFVDINSGSDSNTGLSPAQAFKTLHHTLPLAAAGDTVHVEAGVYSIAKGEPDVPLFQVTNIMISGAPGGATIIDGAGSGGVPGSNWTVGMHSSGTGVTTLIANLVFRNFSEFGMVLSDSAANVDKCRFENNQSGVKIEGISVIGANLENCIFTDNSVRNLQIDDPNGLGFAFVYHSTFDGGQVGVFINDGSTTSVSAKYNIFANQSQYGVQYSGFATIDYNCFFNPGIGNVSGGTPGPNNITADPQFHSGYRLDEASPCVDAIPPAAGDPVFEDHNGLSRPYNTNWDMGAFEFRPMLTQSITFNPGTTVQDFRIAAMPLAAVDPSPQAVLGPYVEPYDTTRVRVGTWDAQLQTYVEYPFTGEDDSILPGDSAWFLFRDGQTLTFQGYKAPTQPAPITSYTSTALPLEQGWNMVGNPFDHPISLVGSDCIVEDVGLGAEPLADGAVTQGIFWVYVNGTYLSASKLNTGQGGWVYSNVLSARIYFRDLAVPYPLVEREVSAYQAVSDSYQRPPAPPGAVDGLGNGTGASGGGGGGGCFIEAVLP